MEENGQLAVNIDKAFDFKGDQVGIVILHFKKAYKMLINFLNQ